MRWSRWLAALLLGCSSGGTVSPPPPPPPPPPPAPVASVTISPGPAISLMVGATSQLAATPRDAQGNALTGRAVVWTSSAEGVARVSTSGLVTGVTPGSAEIRAASEGKTGAVTATVSANPWSVTGSLNTGRTLHTATLLSNGKVLVVGGQNLGPVFQTFASCELYDPATGTWTLTGSLATGRENHIAIRLANGKVLVAGGRSIELQIGLSTSELYDPITGLWSATGSLSTARELGAAVLLPDGRVLISGGAGLDDATAELYDPATGTWTATGSMIAGRGAHTATLLANGKVLVAGGAAGTFTNPVFRPNAELYDPATGTWTATGSLLVPRGFHRTVLLANGKALVVGGSNFTTTVYSATELYDPAIGTWSGTGAMVTERISHIAITLPNGRTLVTGGFALGGAALLSTESFDPAPGTWSATTPPAMGRGNHAAVLLANGKVLVVGGQPVAALASAEIFDPAAAFPAIPFGTSLRKPD